MVSTAFQNVGTYIVINVTGFVYMYFASRAVAMFVAYLNVSNYSIHNLWSASTHRPDFS